METLLRSVYPAQTEDPAGASSASSAHRRGANVLQETGLGRCLISRLKGRKF